ncbi:MAG TPA: hypothetical protein VF426_04270 [Marmoricola sp.]
MSRPHTSHYRYRTKSGIKVGATVKQLRAKESGMTVSADKPYGDAYLFYQHPKKHRWVDYAVVSKASSRSQISPSDKIEVIDVAAYKIEGGGSCLGR